MAPVQWPLHAGEVALDACDAVATATILNWNGSQADAAASKEAFSAHLQTRVGEIVDANPWLAGRLVRPGPEAIHLVMPEQGASSSMALFMHAMDDTGLAMGTSSYADMSASLMDKYSLPRARECVDCAKHPLFRVVLLDLADGATSIVVVSMCHLLGDAATFYLLYRMLDADEPVASLPAFPRLDTFPALSRAALGPRMDALMADASFLGGMADNLARPGAMTARVWHINAAVVNDEKAKHTPTAEAPFLSSNDVLCAWFAAGCTTHTDPASRAKAAMMVLNMRMPRLAAVPRNQAGNYQSVVAWRFPDAMQPASLRQSLLRLAQHLHDDKDQDDADDTAHDHHVTGDHDDRDACFEFVDGTLPEDIGGATSVSSNWSPFFHELCPAGATHTMHVPLYPTAKSHCGQAMILFMAGKGRPAALTLTHQLELPPSPPLLAPVGLFPM